MSSPISSPGVSPVGSSWELYPTDAEETRDIPSTSRSLCQGSNQQVSTIARHNSSENLTEQKLDAKPIFEKYRPAEKFFLDCNPSPETLAKNFPGVVVIADGIANLMEAGGIQHDFTPTEAQEFVDTMRAIRRPVGNKIIRNMKEGTSTIEFRPQHGLLDIHSLGLFLEQKGGFAGCTAEVHQEAMFNKKEFKYSAINVKNPQDLVTQRYKQLWEDRDPENSEEYEIPEGSYPSSTMWPEKKKTVDQLEKELSYQERFLRRAINMMNSKQKESDEENPFDPAFKRIFIPTEKERITNKIALPKIAGLTSIFFEYKTQVVPLEQEIACIAGIYAMPTLYDR